MPAIHFQTTLITINDWTILRLPQEASAQLPSRGMVLVEGAINTFPFKNALEPDGNRSHWLRIDDATQKAIGAKAGDTVEVAITPSKDWPEPAMPTDMQKALAGSADAHELWIRITPMARWEWIRWIRATNNTETRARRIDVAMSKLKSGMRRPCCFNQNMCTEPSVSKNGVLLEPQQV